MEDSKLVQKSIEEGSQLIRKSRTRLFNSYQAQLFDILCQGFSFFGYDELDATVSKFMSYIDAVNIEDKKKSYSPMPDDIREASVQSEKDNSDLPF